MSSVFGLFDMRALTESAMDGVWLIDERGMVEYVNPAGATLCGYGAAELIGRAFSMVLPESVAHHHQTYVDAYVSGIRTASILGQVRHLSILHRDGTEVPVLLKAFNVASSGDRRLFGAIMSDLRPTLALSRERDALIDKLSRLAMIDELTDLPNRRAFQRAIAPVEADINRSGGIAHLAILDLDHFKRVNDRYGHDAGDRVLRQFAEIARSDIRGADTLARLGGEEFGLLLQHSGEQAARRVLERVREEVASHPFDLGEARTCSLTCSIGFAALAPGRTTETAMKLADVALYASKEAGRNRVSVWRDANSSAAIIDGHPSRGSGYLD